MSLDIQIIRILDLIDRYGSMSKAALAIGRVPSSLSHAISKAEKQLNFALVKPDGRTVELTATGITILEDGRELLQGLEKLDKKINQIESGVDEELIVGIDINLPVSYMIEWVQQFMSSNHRAIVNIIQKSSEDLVKELEMRKVHLIVGSNMDRQTHARNITSRALISSQQGLVVSANYPIAEELKQQLLTHKVAEAIGQDSWSEAFSKCSWQELTWITLTDDDSYTYPAELRPFIRRTISVPNRQAQWIAISMGLGVGFVPEKSIAMLAKSSLLDNRKGNKPRPDMGHQSDLANYGLIWLTSHHTWQSSFQAAWNNQRMDQSLRWFVKQLDNVHLRTSLF